MYKLMITLIACLFTTSAYALDKVELTEAYRHTVEAGDFVTHPNQTMNEIAIRYNDSGERGTDLYNAVDTRVNAVLYYRDPQNKPDAVCEGAFSLAVIAAGTRDFNEVTHAIGFDTDTKWKAPLKYVTHNPKWVARVVEAVGVSNDGFYADDHSVLVQSCVDNF